MAVIGNLLGQAAGHAVGKKFGNAKAGQSVGGVVGGLLPFKKGGRVPGKKGAPKRILAHGGEYIIPNGVKVPKSVKSAVNKLKAKK